MELIFESECSEAVEVRAYRVAEGVWIGATCGPITQDLTMIREDAEAMARAILGIPHPSVFDWESAVADMRAQAALEAIDRARESRHSRVAVA